MTVRERILMLRLLNKLGRQPAYSKALGIEATSAWKNENPAAGPKGLNTA